MSQQEIGRPRGPRRWWIRPLVALLAVGWILVVLLGGDEPESTPRPPDPPRRPFTVGRGARSALVLPAQGDRRRPVVVFLHGWGLIGREAYRPWMDHLAARGSTVIVPRYQTSIRTSSATALTNAVAGVRGALRLVRPRPRNVVVVGHSAGGVLAVEYAVSARRLKLPAARAVVAIYPGSALRDLPPIPQSDPAALPSATRRLLVLASPLDEVVGTGPAQAIHDGAVNIADSRRELVTVDDPVAGKHFAPVVHSPAAREQLWRRVDDVLDRLG